MKDGHLEWNCSEHECKPGSDEWRSAMGLLLGFDIDDAPDQTDDNFAEVAEALDGNQLCPMCVMDLMDKAKEAPRQAIKIAFKSAKKRIEQLERELADRDEALAVVVDFVKGATGEDPYKAGEGYTPCGGEPAGFADRLSNLLHAAVLKRVQEKTK